MLTDREKKILIAVVKEYIKRANTVSSRTIAKKYGLNLSSATIRNVMADLEEMGFLYQPHISAGRIPTLSGFKVYIENILEEIAREDKGKMKEVEEIKEKIEYLLSDKKETVSVMRVLPRVLAECTKYAGIAYTEFFSGLKIERIEFLAISANKILVVLVFEGEYIYTRIIRLPEEVNKDRIERINEYLREKTRGLTLYQLIHSVFRDMKEDHSQYVILLQKVLKKEIGAIKEAENVIIIEKSPEFFEHPEFSDVEKMKNILKAFEDKELIVKVLKEIMKEGTGIAVIMGEDTKIEELRDVSFVVAHPKGGKEPEVVIGIAGPVRMEYERVIPIVDEVSTFLKEQWNIK